MNDTRTEAERRYDATRLSPLPTAPAPIPPGAPAITVQPFICTDTLSANYGQSIGTSYLLNGVEVYVPDNPAQPVQLELPTTMGGRLNGMHVCITPSALDHEPHLALDSFAAVSALLNAPQVQAAITRKLAGTPAELPHVEALTWESEGKRYTDYYTGIGLVRTVIGICGSDKAGLELIVGGRPINEHLDEVLTLADVRQLRDNLTALLEDTRLQAAVE